MARRRVDAQARRCRTRPRPQAYWPRIVYAAIGSKDDVVVRVVIRIIAGSRHEAGAAAIHRAHVHVDADVGGQLHHLFPLDRLGLTDDAVRSRSRDRCRQCAGQGQIARSRSIDAMRQTRTADLDIIAGIDVGDDAANGQVRTAARRGVGRGADQIHRLLDEL